MTNLRKQIINLSDRFFERVVGWRRHLHQYPELSFNEYETSKYIASQLKSLGVAFEENWADTGILATIEGNDPNSKMLMLRADMDALPIKENNTHDYVSKNEGVMHACGHDVHSSSLLGTAAILQQIRNNFQGTIKLIFQPGEEKLPGGASILLKEGLFEKHKPKCILGQHVHPPLESGKVGFCEGAYMASADELFLTVIGRGGHGALPQDCIDPIVVTAQILNAIQQIVSRKALPTTPSVLTFGKINSEGGATNVIPNKVFLEGTFRTFDENWRKEAHILMKNMAFHIAKAFGAKIEFDIKVGYPYVKNNSVLTNKMFSISQSYLGEENVVWLKPRMTAEDFGYYSHEVSACFYRLGTGNEKKNTCYPVHTNQFNIDEDALKLSIGLMAFMAIHD